MIFKSSLKRESALFIKFIGTNIFSQNIQINLVQVQSSESVIQNLFRCLLSKALTPAVTRHDYCIFRIIVRSRNIFQAYCAQIIIRRVDNINLLIIVPIANFNNKINFHVGHAIEQRQTQNFVGVSLGYGKIAAHIAELAIALR